MTYRPKDKTIMSNLLVFGLVGLLAGTAARMFYPQRQALRILGTLVLGILGGLGGGMFSWIYWPSVDGQFQSGNLVLSFLGAMAAILIAAAVGYVRSLNAFRNTSR